MKKFEVEFHPVSSGWGSFQVVADNQEAGIVTSYAFDPYESLIKWLERIVEGRPESMVEIDEEGRIKTMIARWSRADSMLNFIVKDFDFPEEPESKEYINILIDEDVLISEFLNKYIDFFATKFDPKTWYYREKEFPDLLGRMQNLEKIYRAGRNPLTIVIEADFGNGPYAWVRGGNIADAVCGFPEEYGVSKELDAKFIDWVTDFERNYEEKSFDWEKFNERGLDYAKQLKKELGDRYLVEYHVPMEDPNYSAEKSIFVID